ncbi:class I SAM-dependent methyltransferase [Actinoplanes sp. TBRC 11911]|uniref:class I SAM-dependent methyltransferase n=1 Tax=Actinoplanes sp. TBRC 11911 TaxID=2729386 RepID=UPI00145E9FA0|nr:class I SAM-dependent methyltransferase [Actinoplanes sp. TBRC 11911]NMO56111.1 class I SAM-dependent methyltransferase [Actinoplanes sp. TBRC 11911]
MTDEQLHYYRLRAGEYDATAFGDVAAASERIARIVGAMRPAGRVLEIACGTGMWTSALAAAADSVTAIDAAPEALAIARDRVRAENVRFEVADVFTYRPGVRFDTIFFSAWLSHVPAARFGEFWAALGGLLAGGGRVLFVDEPVSERAKETYISDEVVERHLRDGRAFRVVKNFIDPGDLVVRLRRLGWECTMTRDDDAWTWVCGSARQVK